MRDSTAPEAGLAKIAVWYAAWSLVQSAATGGLVGTATDFMLKDGLGLDAGALARYGTILGLPAYLAFLFGYARDRWSPRLGGDRPLIMLEAVVAALALGLLASGRPAYGPILITMLALRLVGRISGAGQNGAMTLFAKRRGVTDRLSGFNLGMNSVGSAALSGAAGWAAGHFPYRTLLAVSAALGLVALALLAFAPKGAFVAPEPVAERESAAPIAAQFAALVRSRPFLAALGLSFAYNFSPESSPAFFYYLTDHLHADAPLKGAYDAIWNLGPLPVALLYGAFARRTSLRNRLAIAMVSLLLGILLSFALRNRSEIVPYGALCGLSNAMYLAASLDLLLSTVPQGSEGFGFAIVGMFEMLVGQVSNLFGAWLYIRHGFFACAWASLPAPLVGLLFLGLVPREGSRPPTPT